MNFFKFFSIPYFCFITKRKFLNTFLLIFVALFFCQTSFAQLNPITTDSRIRTLVYNPNEVYELRFYYGYQSFIEFADDEEIEMMSIGEAFAWRLTPAGKRLFVRPLEIAGHTNMTIITNKRTYHFDIRSGEYEGKADEELVYTVRFFYPQVGQPLPIPPVLTAPNPAPIPVLPIRDEKTIIRTPFPQANADENLPNLIARTPPRGDFNFDYILAGSGDKISPLKIYDDGIDTFFQFANDNAIIPSISLVDKFGNEQTLSYINRDNYIVVPVVGAQFSLRLGSELICVFNNKILRK